MVIQATLNQGIDSFVRVANYLRRKEFAVKKINMEALKENRVDLKIEFEDKHKQDSIVSFLSKLQDLNEIEVLN
ncbi:hypothetical protein CLOACE_16170 [Clostridium acetireducens DSM 10703]|uniref:ACT domain-containing protein n=1 Tax=Clostridium acetireducens DSM 10703 TaxID=1121290 RepID=A0A1E8EYB3_9CLOT|nr:ACT domain-containing protein [Clostridium acetireducens]OFI05534.1 hypothetical protein CLOACE_16170 [Clostridium acetireducens DSM 10703]